MSVNKMTSRKSAYFSIALGVSLAVLIFDPLPIPLIGAIIGGFFTIPLSYKEILFICMAEYVFVMIKFSPAVFFNIALFGELINNPTMVFFTIQGIILGIIFGVTLMFITTLSSSFIIKLVVPKWAKYIKSFKKE